MLYILHVIHQHLFFLNLEKVVSITFKIQIYFVVMVYVIQ